jgi:hypothetical protein
MKVTYADGREVVVLASARAKLLTEEHFDGIGDKNKLRATFYLAWASLHRAGKEAAGFDAWVDLIEDVEDVDEEEADPTLAVPPTGSSSS